jgi:AcrR family transcriptional regulator
MKVVVKVGEDEIEAGEGCRPLRADAARNRERILLAAAQVFAQRGLDATLDDVATCAGVGVGTVYRRFSNKEALVDALFEKAVGDVVRLAEDAAAMEDSWTGLVWFIEHATRMQAEDLGLRDVVLFGDYGRDRVAQAKDRIVPAVTSLVERAQRDGHLRADFVTSDVPIIELMLTAVADYTSGIAPDLWLRYLGIVLDGMCAERKNPRALPAAPTHEAVEAAVSARRRRCRAELA